MSIVTSIATVEVEKCGMISSKFWGRGGGEIPFLYPSKLAFKNKGKIKTLSDNQK